MQRLAAASLTKQLEGNQKRLLKLPPGEWEVREPLRFARPDLRIVGDLENPTVLTFVDPGAGLQLLGDDQQLRDVTLRGTAVARTAPLLRLNAHSIVLTDVRVHGGDCTGYPAVELDGRSNNANHLTIDRLRIQRAGFAMLLYGKDGAGSDFRHVVVRDCGVGVVESGAFLGNDWWKFIAYGCGPAPAEGGRGFAFVCTESSVDVLQPGFWKGAVAEVRKRLVPARNSRTGLWGPYVESGQFVYVNPPQQSLGGMPSSTFGCPSFANGELRLVDIVKPTVHVDGLRLRSANSKNPGVWSATDGAESVDLNWKGAGKLSGRLPKAR